jgi:folate-binding protein YgfZ
MINIDPATVETHSRVRSAGGYRRESGRSLVAVTGADRQIWLHNLTTNAVSTLKPGDGNYAFAINVQGRTLFDLNILVFTDHLWLDIDERWLAPALAHFNKYTIVEDVQLADISTEWSRFEVLGPATAECVEMLGLGHNFGVFANVQHVTGSVNGINIELVKDNVGPIPRAVVYVPNTSADTTDPPPSKGGAGGGSAVAFARVLAAAAAKLGMAAIDDDLFESIRIEAGRPTSLADIDDQVIPPETLQIERGISYVKGCYLGQEVIERMRSRGSMARKLVGLQVEGDQLPEHNAPIFANGKEVGRITSACRSPALNGVLAMGYLKSLLVGSDAELQVAVTETTTTRAQLVTLPLSVWG